jgi:hypothetical protein
MFSGISLLSYHMVYFVTTTTSSVLLKPPDWQIFLLGLFIVTVLFGLPLFALGCFFSAITEILKGGGLEIETAVKRGRGI